MGRRGPGFALVHTRLDRSLWGHQELVRNTRGLELVQKANLMGDYYRLFGRRRRGGSKLAMARYLD
jgi:hypothetical protein